MPVQPTENMVARDFSCVEAARAFAYTPSMASGRMPNVWHKSLATFNVGSERPAT